MRWHGARGDRRLGEDPARRLGKADALRPDDRPDTAFQDRQRLAVAQAILVVQEAVVEKLAHVGRRIARGGLMARL